MFFTANLAGPTAPPQANISDDGADVNVTDSIGVGMAVGVTGVAVGGIGVAVSVAVGGYGVGVGVFGPTVMVGG
jgi:hypothetical protein